MNNRAVTALADFLKELETEYLPRAVNEFALGEEKYRNLLLKSTGLDFSVEKLLQLAEKDLEANYAALMTIQQEQGADFLEQVRNEAPTMTTFFDTIQASVHRTRQFIQDKDLITIPTSRDCTIAETPKFARATAFAIMNAANVAEDSPGTDSYYYITPPDPNWTAEQQRNFLKFFAQGNLESLTAHEV